MDSQFEIREYSPRQYIWNSRHIPQDEQWSSWREFFELVFGKTLGADDLTVNDRVGVVADVLLVNVKGITISAMLQAWERRAAEKPRKRSRTAPLPFDQLMLVHPHCAPKGAYGLWAKKDWHQGDAFTAGMSAKEARDKRIRCTSLAEELLFWLKYLYDIGIPPVTGRGVICAGCRLKDGTVPAVSLKENGLNVIAVSPDFRDATCYLRTLSA